MWYCVRSNFSWTVAKISPNARTKTLSRRPRIPLMDHMDEHVLGRMMEEVLISLRG